MTQWCLTTSGAKVAVYMVVAHIVRDDPHITWDPCSSPKLIGIDWGYSWVRFHHLIGMDWAQSQSKVEIKLITKNIKVLQTPCNI